ncbi:unnamed protein product [Closterium sp. NIES-53]
MVGSTRYISNAVSTPTVTYVTVANNTRLRASAQGIVVLKARGSRTHITLSDVLIVHNLCFNLLSAAQLMDCRVDLSTDPETRDILLHYTMPNKTRKQIERVHSENGVYILDFSTPDFSGDSQELIDLVPLDCHTPTASTSVIADCGLAAITEAEREAPPEEGLSNMELETAMRVVFRTEENPLPIPASQHLRGMLCGTGVGTFDAHGVPRPYTKEKFLEIYSHQRDSTKKFTVVQEEELVRRKAEELLQRSLAEGEEEEIKAEPPVVPLGRPPCRTAPALPPPDILPGSDPWDTIDRGNEPSTPRRTIYGPAPKPCEPTFSPGTIPGTNIPLSTILDREFLALMLMTANKEEVEKATAELAQAPDEDPAEAHARYMRTSGFRADDAIWHQRLGHPSHVALKNCIEADMFAPGAGSFPPLELGTNRYAKLEKVYSDFLNVGHCGINDELYTLTFVDAGMRYVWIINVEARSIAYEVFRLWLAHAQRQSREKLKIWQSDDAAEFRSKELQDYLARKGIEHHISLPYAHKQQGVAERTNLMLMTKARLILDLMSQKGTNARDVIFYERLFLWQFREDEQANANRVYANDGHSYASPEDEAAAAILEQDTRGEFTRGNRHDEGNDDDNSLGEGAGAAGGGGSGSGRDAAPPAPPELESDDDNVQEVIPQHCHNSTVSGLQLLGLHTTTSMVPRDIKPKNPRQALTGPHGKEWHEAMDAEIKALESRDTWVLVDRAAIKGRRILSGKWVFRVKTVAGGTIERLSSSSAYLAAERWMASNLQRPLQFFISTPNVGLCYSTIPTVSFNLIGYMDADHAAGPDNQRSRKGFLFRLEPSGPISWNSHKQELVALLSAEAEFIAATTAVREGLYLQELLQEVKIPASANFRLHCDNQSSIKIANKPGFVNHTKHIASRYFFVKDEVDKGKVDLTYCTTGDMAAEFLTKQLSRQQYQHCSELSGVVKRVKTRYR